MADRIPFATVNDSVVPARSSGFNGFPFPFASGSSPDNPIVVNYLDCIKWWWRVKNWTISTDLQEVDNASATWTLDNGTMNPGPRNSTREFNLIAPTEHSFGIGDSTTNGFSMAFMGAIGSQIILNAGQYYPDITGNGFVGPNPTDGQVQIFLGSVPGFPEISGTIDGYTIPIAYDATTNPPSSYVFTTFVMTPVEYWPYAATNGSPIYNTSTGAQLQSPLS